MPFETPEWFGQYRLSSRIATGGMAEVSLGRRVTASGEFGPLVALKRLLPHYLRDSDVVRMFVNEAKITAQIHHANVVKIVEVGQVGSEPFIAMELLEGHTFAELRQQAASAGRRVPLGIALRVLAEACRGLDAAHRAVDEEGRPLCIVHRDFTPDNIHVGVDGDVKVIDFGIAKAESLGSGTEPGTLKGKFFYMSPEMIAGRAVDHRADLFAAGVMLYEQLCGRRPFTGLSSEEVLDRIAEGKPKLPTEFDPSVPRPLEAICLRALARDPAHRFPAITQFASEIEYAGAEVASRQAVAEYIAQLFPEDKDAKRLTLRRAVLADKTPGVIKLSEVVSAPAANPPPAAAAAPAKSAISFSARQLRIAAVALGAAVLLGGGGIATWKLWPAAMTPAERLSRAEREKDPSRVSLLKPLATDERATQDQLERAAQLLADAEAFEPALTMLETLRQRFPKSLDGALLEAKLAIRLRQGKRAEAAIKIAGQLAPKDERPDELLGSLRQMQGDLGGAVDALKQAQQKNPKDAALLSRTGRLQSQLGRLDDAAETLNAALALRYDADDTAELGYIRFRQEKMDQALSTLKRAARRSPKAFLPQYYLGAVLFRHGDASGAEKAYREADAIAPADPRPLAALCEVLAKSGNPSGADGVKAELARRFPKDAPALVASCTP